MRGVCVCGLALIAAACIFPNEVCGCLPPAGTATVVGTVTRAGAPVAGAQVTIGSRQPGCDNPLVPAGLEIITDAEGAYQFLLRGVADSACLRVVARGPAGAAGDSAAADPVPARLAPVEDPRARPESVRVNLQLPSAP